MIHFRKFVGLGLAMAGLLAVSEVHVAPDKSPAKSTRPTKAALVDEIDSEMRKLWAKKGVHPSPRLDDDAWVRRAYLDLIGRVPTLAELEKFHKSPQADRRRIACESLVRSEEWKQYTSHQLEMLFVGMESEKLDNGELKNFRSFHLRGERYGTVDYPDPPPDDSGMAASASFLGGRPFVFDDPNLSLASARIFEPDKLNVHAAALAYAQRNSYRMDSLNGELVEEAGGRYYYGREGLVDHLTSTFLGESVACVQCHGNLVRPKTGPKMDDFWGLVAAFRLHTDSSITPLNVNSPVSGSTSFEYTNALSGKKATAKPSYFGKPIPVEQGKSNPAVLAMEQLLADKKFSRNFANRFWDQMFGAPLNSPFAVNDLAMEDVLAPELLDKLATKFKDSNYDPAPVLEAICKSEAYSLGPAESEKAEFAFQHTSLKGLTQTQLNNIFFQLLDLKDHPQTKAYTLEGLLKQPKQTTLAQRIDLALLNASHSPASPIGRQGIQAGERLMAVPAVLAMMNHPVFGEVSELLGDKFTKASQGKPNEAVDHAFRALIGTKPSEDALKVLAPQLKTPDGTFDKGAYQDLVWSLLQSSAFHQY